MVTGPYYVLNPGDQFLTMVDGRPRLYVVDDAGVPQLVEDPSW